jgi:hypothetical protein
MDPTVTLREQARMLRDIARRSGGAGNPLRDRLLELAIDCEIMADALVRDPALSDGGHQETS